MGINGLCMLISVVYTFTQFDINAALLFYLLEKEKIKKRVWWETHLFSLGNYVPELIAMTAHLLHPAQNSSYSILEIVQMCITLDTEGISTPGDISSSEQ